jgi:hypothetical protein
MNFDEFSKILIDKGFKSLPPVDTKDQEIGTMYLFGKPPCSIVVTIGKTTRMSMKKFGPTSITKYYESFSCLLEDILI